MNDMTMTKRLFLLFLLVGSNFLLIAAQTLSYTDSKGIIFKFKIKNTEAVIKSFDQKAQFVTIPAVVSWQGTKYPVTHIDTYISGNNYAAEQIVIPDCVKSIANYAFNEFRQLKVVQLPLGLRDRVSKCFRKGVRFVDDINSVNPKPVSDSVVPKVEPPIVPVVSDIDINIPESKEINENTFCVIIGNEHYDEASNADYAVRDAESFRSYCEKTLGIPKHNIEYKADATFANMRKSLNFIKEVERHHRTPEKISFLVYYAGHGFNSVSGKSTFLLPKDGNPNDTMTCIRLADVYNDFSRLRVSSVVFFLDACFSGMKRGSDNVPLVAARSVVIAPRKDRVQGNLVVFSATSDAQTAMPYESQQHGLFTYYLLKELQKSKGKITLGELVTEVEGNVKQNSVTINRKSQTPWINVSSPLSTTWKNIKLK